MRPVDRAHPYCVNRLFEWTMALTLMLLGLWMLAFPASMGASAFHYINAVIGNFSLMAFFLLVGGFRISALIANGRWKIWGGRIRALGSWAGAIIWLQMAVALAMLIPNVGTPPSPGIPVYFALAIAELISTYRARADGHYNR
jgi:uncharacterized membrane protein